MNMTVRPGQATTLSLNDQPLDFGVLNVKEVQSLPFTILTVDGKLMFDTEVWMNDEIKYLMPAASKWVTNAIARFESESSQGTVLEIPQEQGARKILLDDLGAQRASNAGAVTHVAWDRLGRMFQAHCLNGEQLKAIFAETLDEEIFITEVISHSADPRAREARLASIDQVVHNFVASGYSLEQQAIILAKNYRGTEFAKRFSRQQENLNSNGSVAFVRDLRAFLQHQTLPYSQQSVSIETNTGSVNTEISISSQELMVNSRWSPNAMVFIETSGVKVDLLAVFTDVFELQKDFWAWALRQANRLNEIDLCVVDELAREFNYIISDGARGRPRLAWAIEIFHSE